MTSGENTTKVHETGIEPEAEPRFPEMVIASHKDSSRIGERFSFRGHSEVSLSRNQPLFHGSSGSARALDDDYISRTPILFRADALGNINIDPNGRRQVSINGQTLIRAKTFSHAEVHRGLVITLAQRVCLLLHETVLPSGNRDDLGLIGESIEMDRVRQEIFSVADLDVPVLIRGESGSGKELVAGALHAAGARSKLPLTAVNMGALSPSLAGAELFGSVRGAFTGSSSDRLGYFRTAHPGTLFLDEIGETPFEVQAMLMRVLETNLVFPVGAQKGFRVDVRLITATDADLEAMTGAGTFKAPLLHRLGAYEIWIPPLRRRRDDIMRLFLHFATPLMGRLAGPVSEKPLIPAGLAARLLSYHWPGNVRQLRNVVNQLVIDSRDKPCLNIGPRVERLLQQYDPEPQPNGTDSRQIPPSRHRKPSCISLDELAEAMAANGWEPARAARMLGIPRTSIYNLIKKYSLPLVDDLTIEQIRATFDDPDQTIESAAESLRVSVNGLRRRMKSLGMG